MRVLHPRVTSGQLSDLARFLLRNFFFCSRSRSGVCVCVCSFSFPFFAEEIERHTHKNKNPRARRKKHRQKEVSGVIKQEKKKGVALVWGGFSGVLQPSKNGSEWIQPSPLLPRPLRFFIFHPRSLFCECISPPSLPIKKKILFIKLSLNKCSCHRGPRGLRAASMMRNLLKIRAPLLPRRPPRSSFACGCIHLCDEGEYEWDPNHGSRCFIEPF